MLEIGASWLTKHYSPPLKGIGRPPFRMPYGTWQVNKEEYIPYLCIICNGAVLLLGQVSSALPFVAMSDESFGRLGAPALTLLGDLADQAMQAGGLGLSRAAFISGTLCELSVALCHGNSSLRRSGAYIATRAAGRTPMRTLARPLAEVFEACLAPRVWVWGVWIGFAWRCITLMYGVLVHLHLALFPAGGPFLPSLFVNLLSTAPCVGLRCLVRLRLALRSLAVWRVLAIAPSFIFDWRAFSSVSLCNSNIYRIPLLSFT
jgi:hypothetical protein